MAYHFTVLPGGNAHEFPLIEQELIALGITPDVLKLCYGGRVYLLSDSDYDKLPKDEKGPYLPVTKDSGHSVNSNFERREQIVSTWYDRIVTKPNSGYELTKKE